MTCDIHTWKPVPGECARYACECGAVGFRRRDRKIVAYRRAPEIRRVWTARDQVGGGAVPALPRLDETERRAR